jgi:hypothetical protein
MADDTSERSSTGLAFVVGGLVVAVIVLAVVIFGGDLFGKRDIDVDVNMPPAQSAPASPTEPAQPAPPSSTQQ